MIGAAWRLPRRISSLSSPPDCSARAFAGVRHAGRLPGRAAAAVLLCLPLLAGLSAPAVAQAPVANADGSYTVPADWALKPSGVADGDGFRLLFITSASRSGSSRNIAHYNTFVQNSAAGGHSAIRPYSAQFRVVGSTSAVHARDNTMTTGTGVPIYWLNGNKLADNYADFYDGSWDDYGKRNERGQRITQSIDVRTGTNNNGTRHHFPLGGTQQNNLSRAGTPEAGRSPLSDGNATPGFPSQLYALSPVFRTPPVVTVSADESLVAEGEAAVFTLTATPAPDAALAVSVAVSEKTGGRRDFVAAVHEKTHTVSIPASGTATLTIPTTRDWIREPEGAVTAEALSGAGYRVGDPSSASVVVADDDGRPRPTAELVPRSSPSLTALPEGAGVVFIAVLSRALASDETVTLPLAVGGTAGGSDYRLVCVETGTAGSGTCNGFGGGGPSITFHGEHTKTHRVTGPLRLEAVRDNAAEPAETVTLSLGGGPTKTITLRDAPSSVTLSFARPTSTLSEANGPLQPVMRTSAAPGGDIAVPLVFTDITATRPSGWRSTRRGCRPGSRWGRRAR